MPKNHSTSNVKTALRVLAIIELFAKEKKPLSLSEIAGCLQAPISSSAALLNTLDKLGYIYETGRRQGFYPTGRLLELAKSVTTADPILKTAYPGLRNLLKATTETIVFAKLGGNQNVVYLHVLDSPNPVRYVAAAGDQHNIHTDALGKALLATLDATARKTILSAKPRPPPEPSAPCLHSIEHNIELSIAQGWFAHSDDSLSDLAGIAWPLRIGGAYYAISICGPLHRIEKNLERYARKLRLTCTLIEQTV